MGYVMLCAAGVGLATVVGSLLAFFVKSIPQRVNDGILGFAAGIMLGASFFSLILPAYDANVWLCASGIVAGAVVVKLMDRFIPHMHNLLHMEQPGEKQPANPRLDRVMLFVIAIAIHNLPEGMAVGVSFGSGDVSNGLSIAIGIALQNLPEGMITILPLLLAGVGKPRAFAVALFTGLTEVAGALFGYLAVSVASVILPFVLALAGGTMLYVVCHDMIPETHGGGHADTASFALIGGLVAMLFIQYFV